MKRVTQEEWGATAPRATTRIAGPVLGVTLHWEGPRMGFPWPHARCARKVRAIERFHQIQRGWSDIAYNELVCPHGYVFEGRGKGFRSAANGVSNIGGNDQWYAVCYIGGIGDKLTEAGKVGMLDAIDLLGGGDVNGHRDHHATECPGDQIYAWIQEGLDVRLTDEDVQKFLDGVVNPNAPVEKQYTVRECLRASRNTRRAIRRLPKPDVEGVIRRVFGGLDA